MSKISCRSTAPLEGKDSILGALAAEKSSLDECAKDKPLSVRVHFAFDAGKTGDVRVKEAPDQKTARCVAAAIKGTGFPKRGACALSLKLGESSEGG